MSLQERLDAMKARFESRTPPYDAVSPEMIKIMHRAVEDLRKSGIVEGALTVGDHAPDFTLSNAEGNDVRSRDLLAEGPLVVSFYRGVW
jgi:hypothetical protein